MMSVTLVTVPCFGFDAGNSDYHNAWWLQVGWMLVLFGKSGS